MRMCEWICFIYVVDVLEKNFREATKMAAVKEVPYGGGEINLT